MDKSLTHLRGDGSPHMVDVGDKKHSKRTAQAEGWVYLNPETLSLISRHAIQKGDVLSIAQLAGICGSKKTSDIIPLCHPIPIDSVTVDLFIQEKGVYILAEVQNTWKTGVEMEAMMAVSSAALCIYDMIKSAQRDAVIGDIKVIFKDGGRSGVFGERKNTKSKKKT